VGSQEQQGGREPREEHDTLSSPYYHNRTIANNYRTIANNYRTIANNYRTQIIANYRTIAKEARR
jgi:hypothetical protein